MRYAGTPLQRGSEAAGVIGLLLSGLLILWRRPQPVVTGAGRAPAYRSDTRPALLFAALLALLAVLKIGLVEPYTGWFRLQSSVERPAGMEHETAARFEGGVELLGYSLRRQEVTQGDALAVRLFWRAREPLRTDYRPYLHLDSPDGSATFANQTKTNAADKPSSTWPTGFYLVDDYLLEVPPATPPLVATLRAGLLRPDGSGLPLQSGGNQVALAQVRVRERSPLQTAGLPGAGQAYRVGELRLVGHDVRCESTGGSCDVTLYWQAPPQASPGENYQVFVHLLDEAGQVVAQRDGAPAGGWYPTGEWLPGQVVEDAVAGRDSGRCGAPATGSGRHVPPGGRRQAARHRYAGDSAAGEQDSIPIALGQGLGYLPR